ncbi:hypothetical protein J2T17_004533 [Paenibacillus mucilaginosus]|uniref:hypothetical protein n=1 Tax=Paenibacillus mucilaginosus TaxID=61624 RepID=UPI003D19E5FC
MLKKKGMLIPLFSMMLLAGSLYLVTDNMTDRRVWNQFKNELNNNQAVKVFLFPPFKATALSKGTILGEKEEKELLDYLRTSKFGSSIREGHGPAPDGTILLRFTDHDVSVSYLIGAYGVSPRFVLSPRHLDSETQFYIESVQAAKFIEAKLSE